MINVMVNVMGVMPFMMVVVFMVVVVSKFPHPHHILARVVMFVTILVRRSCVQFCHIVPLIRFELILERF